MKAVIRILQVILKEKKVETAVLISVFTFVIMLMFLPLLFSKSSDFDYLGETDYFAMSGS